jgi:hypothetical protein
LRRKYKRNLAKGVGGRVRRKETGMGDKERIKRKDVEKG